MLALVGTTDKMQIQLAGAKSLNDCPFVAVWQDESQLAEVTDVKPIIGRTSGATNGVTAVDMVPASGLQPRMIRKLKTLNFTNQDNAAVTVKINYFDGTNTRIIQNPTLQAGEMMEYEETFGWNFYDVNGALKSQAAGTSSAASSADSKAVSVSVNTSIADSKAVSDSVIISTNLSAATVSFSTNASTSLSSAVSVSVNTSTANSAALSVSLNASVADSKAVSVSANTSVADSKAVSDSVNISIVLSRCVSRAGC